MKILQGDVLEKLREIPDETVQCCVTSPPYWGLRDYGTAEWEGGDLECKHIAPARGGTGEKSKVQGTAKNKETAKNNQYTSECKKCGARRIDQQIGLEKTPDEYVERMRAVFAEVRRVLRPDGTLWLNLGDSYVSAKGRHANKQQTISGKPRGEPGDGKRPDLRGHAVLKDKDLAGIPWHVAFALQADGWYLRSDIIWHKRNCLPESVRDRPTKAHEYIFLLTKSAKYYYDAEAIYEKAAYDGRNDTQFKGGVKYKGFQEQTMLSRGHERWPKKMKNLEYDGQEPNTMHKNRANGLSDKEYPARNRRDVWNIATQPFAGAHFATFPPEIPELCIKAGTKKGDIVLDPFAGSGTTLWVAKRMDRQYIGIELNEKYIREIIEPRLADVNPLFEQEKETSLFDNG